MKNEKKVTMTDPRALASSIVFFAIIFIMFEFFMLLMVAPLWIS